MVTTPLEYADSLRIGTVDFVSPDEIKVLLELDAPDVVALNTGSPYPFPRINGYVLIPNDGGYLVGQVEWITIERSPFPKRRGLQDFGLIDLPYPLRKLSLNPLGTLCLRLSGNAETFEFSRGVSAYPTVGQPVLLPTTKQLRSIVESGNHRRVWIGTSPLAANATIKIDPDRLFGRHLAVLGNTGSGKSCSVAGLIRWSLEAAEEARRQHDSQAQGSNARFIILDPNGEYSDAFQSLNNTVGIKRFAVDPMSEVEQLRVPLWLWNSEEWCAFAQAAPGAQRPLLRKALQHVRTQGTTTKSTVFAMRNRVSSVFYKLNQLVESGENYEGWKFGPKLEAFSRDLEAYANEFPHYRESLSHIKQQVDQLHENHQTSGNRYESFARSDVDVIVNLVKQFLDDHSGTISAIQSSTDTPRYFSAIEILKEIESLATSEQKPQYYDSLIARIRLLLSDEKLQRVINDDEPGSLVEWLQYYIGYDENKRASVTIIDLSLIPAEVVHTITAVIARMTLEAQQRYRKMNGGKVLPTVLVMEEAHTFIKRYKEDGENQNNAAVCCQVFEKIAREGRKFGLGLVLSSQRPSELSPTVLSQCNTFLLHRISNDRDQDLVHRLVPDNLRGLLRDLPSLPARQAILLGWAAELPTLVDIRELPKKHRPRSADPGFWNVWSRKEECPVDWQKIADDWQRVAKQSDTIIANITNQYDDPANFPDFVTDNSRDGDDDRWSKSLGFDDDDIPF